MLTIFKGTILENLKKIFRVFSLLFCTFLSAEIYDYNIQPSSQNRDSFMSIKILDTKELKFSSSDVKEISALAYKNKTLYALGDKGYLYSFGIKIKDNKIKKVSLKKVFKLKNSKSKRLKKDKRDSEGLCFMDENLLISFEKEPRIELFSKNGKKIKSKKIHKDLKDIRNYKGKNKALESVAYNKKYGLLTAPESPLKSSNKKLHTLYGENNKWNFPVSGKITALEFMKKNEIMILQRYFNNLTRQRIITISKLNLKNSKYKVLARLDSKKGWNIDNFEGLTKINEKRYLIVSDDNDSIFQKTLLVLFEVD